ncbi:MAG: hypothetical protein ABI836_05865 [Gemmatimonadota bacterium]
MGFRNFTDTEGRKWEVRDRSKTEWTLLPLGGNTERQRTVRSPGYEKDPFELSEEELQRLLSFPDNGARARPSKNPFND